MELRKIAAACLAATMMFGAAPILAADESPVEVKDPSPVPSDMYDYSITYAPGSATVVNGPKGEIFVEGLPEDVIKEVDTQEKVEKIIKDAGYVVPENATILVTGADYSLYKEGTTQKGFPANPENKIDVNGKIKIALDAYDTWRDKLGYSAGETVYVMHKKADGKWEVIESVVNEKGEIVVTLEGLSPIVIARIMSDGSIVELKKAETVTNNNVVNTKKVSPNTGI